MELKVWVDRIQRIVCGVTESTTCQDVVFALAHATGKIGRFTLIERWRNNERLLAPTDNPLKILMKWGEYSSDVQFILQRSDQQQTMNNAQTKQQQQQQSQQQLARQQQQQQTVLKENEIQSTTGVKVMAAVTIESGQLTDKIRDVVVRKSINLGTNQEIKNPDNIGVVKGVPQKPPPVVQSTHQYEMSPSVSSGSNTPEYAYVIKTRTNAGGGEFNSADIRNSLDRKINVFKDTTITTTTNNRAGTGIVQNNDNLMDVLNRNHSPADTIISGGKGTTTTVPVVGVSSNGALFPPPYRDPPPPRSSPSSQKSTEKKYELKLQDNGNMNIIANMNDINELNEVLLNNAHYKDLIQLIKYQREKINLQQADLTKFDAEIVYLENRERDQMQQLEAISREFNKTDQIFRQGNEQLQTLQYVEEENELVRQQEKTLKSEITLLRSKLANCETELLQCKNKVRLLMDDIQIEQRTLNRQYDNRQQIERHFLIEVEKIQSEIEQAIQTADSSNKTTDNLKREVAVIENAIAEKKKQVEQLVNEMKEVNLQSLAIAPSEEIRHLLEGSNRPGSTRRMIGSPRQLENAVPTNKNPHGVWV